MDRVSVEGSSGAEPEPPGEIASATGATGWLTAERRMAFLYRITRVLGEDALDVRARLEHLTQLAVPELADRCAVYLRREGRVAERGAGSEAKEGDLEIAEVLASGVARLTPERMIVPLARGETCGALELCSTRRERCYHERDLDLAGELADRAAAALEIARLYEESKRAIRAREELMAVVSHDLRNPLSAVAMSAAVLERSVPPGDKARRAAESIQRSTERMARLIGDLLDLSRIEGGRLRLDQEPIPASALIGEAIEQVAELAEERSIRIERELSLPLTISCDRERILQVLANFTDNAIKFTPSGGRITVSVEERRGAARFFVEDTGPGVAPALRARLFERYFQAEPRTRQGVGLGLAIAKGIIEAHGGTIGVESAPGCGARFWFELPLVT